MKLSIKKAARHEQHLRIGLVGPSGSGKTYTALRLARGLVGPEGKILVIDTERGSASLYAGEPECAGEFDVIELDSYAPETLTQAIRLGEQEGYGAIVIDSLSHFWQGKDGALEQVEKAAKRSGGGNQFAGWRDVTPRHNSMIDAILAAKAHMLVTMRSKTEWVLEQDSRGKQVPRKVGLQPVQRPGMEYEFTIVGEISQDHDLVISKSRISAIADAVINKPGAETAQALLDWLSGAGEDATPHMETETQPQATQATQGGDNAVPPPPSASRTEPAPEPDSQADPKRVTDMLAAYAALGYDEATVLEIAGVQGRENITVGKLNELRDAYRKLKTDGVATATTAADAATDAVTDATTQEEDTT